MRTSVVSTTIRFPVDRLVLEYGDDGSAVLIVHLGAAHSPVAHDDGATEPVYAMSPRAAPLASGADVDIGRRPSRRLLAAGMVVVVVALAGIATVNTGSRSAPALEPATSVPIPSAVIDDAVPPLPARPTVCRGDAPFSPEGCTPDKSGSTSGVSPTEAIGCLSLIRTAAQALALDPDTYAQVLATRTDTTQTIEGAVRQQLTQARLFLASHLQNAGSAADPLLSISLDGLDAAIAAADAALCPNEAEGLYPPKAA
jgi:hypothetical protein